jgi:hypothetical protein
LNERAAFRIGKDRRDELLSKVAKLQRAEIEAVLMLRHALQLRTNDVKSDGVRCEERVNCEAR